MKSIADATATVDAWFDAWAIADDQAREELLGEIVTPGIRFRDRFSLLDGLADLTRTSARRSDSCRDRPARKGDVRHCQGTALVDWIAAGSDGVPRMWGRASLSLRRTGESIRPSA